ncbi:hypothetical protein BGZ94_004813 [Podila epigama]|nr:hypothetical protein BGZ94_004813 [Podila epigama]
MTKLLFPSFVVALVLTCTVSAAPQGAPSSVGEIPGTATSSSPFLGDPVGASAAADLVPAGSAAAIDSASTTSPSTVVPVDSVLVGSETNVVPITSVYPHLFYRPEIDVFGPLVRDHSFLGDLGVGGIGDLGGIGGLGGIGSIGGMGDPLGGGLFKRQLGGMGRVGGGPFGVGPGGIGGGLGPVGGGVGGAIGGPIGGPPNSFAGAPSSMITDTLIQPQVSIQPHALEPVPVPVSTPYDFPVPVGVPAPVPVFPSKWGCNWGDIDCDRRRRGRKHRDCDWNDDDCDWWGW